MIRITDVRCPSCGKKLAEAIEIKAGGIVRFTCPGCHKPVKFEDSPGASR